MPRLVAWIVLKTFVPPVKVWLAFSNATFPDSRASATVPEDMFAPLKFVPPEISPVIERGWMAGPRLPGHRSITFVTVPLDASWIFASGKSVAQKIIEYLGKS